MSTRRAFLMRSAAVCAVALASEQGAQAVETVAPVQPASNRRRSGVVQTVQGPIEASKLGFTLPHEHVCSSSAGYWQAWPEYFGGRANFIAKAVDKLKAAKAEGVDTLVDVTTIDLGRDIRLIEEVSRKSGMQIVACTGHWLDPSFSMKSRTVEELTEFFIKEIEHGIEGTDIKAGIIKMATDQEGVTPFGDKALRAGARASQATGVPIETHAFARGRIGEKQAEIFEAEGVNPAMVCIGHSDDTDDMEYLIGLAKRGYTIGMDRIPSGIQMPTSQSPGGAVAAQTPIPWQKRAECVKNLIDAGFDHKVFLSHDWSCGISLQSTERIKAKDRMNPDGMLFNIRKTIPYLKQIGVSARAIHVMTVENPRRFFGGI